MADIGKDLAFVTDIGVFSGVILGVAIPLAYGVVSRISEKYNSDVISSLFANRLDVKFFPFILVTNIVVAVFLRYLGHLESDWGANELFHCLLLISFLISVVWTLQFIHVLSQHSNPDYIVGKLLSRVSSRK